MSKLFQVHYELFILHGGTPEQYVEKYADDLDGELNQKLKEIQRAYHIKGPSKGARMVFEFQQRQKRDAAQSAPAALAA